MNGSFRADASNTGLLSKPSSDLNPELEFELVVGLAELKSSD